MSKDLRGAGGRIQSVLTMLESYAKQVSFQSSFKSSERCTINNVRRQRIPNSRSRAAESSIGNVSALSSFIANAHNAFYTRKGGLI